MTRYIDADKLPRHGNRGGVVYWRDIEKQPTADVVEVVRCKDCKYRHKEWHHDKRNKNGGYWISWCDNDAIAERVYGLAFEYDFCSYGERIEE